MASTVHMSPMRPSFRRLDGVALFLPGGGRFKHALRFRDYDA